MAEMQMLLNEDIPRGRKDLIESHSNLKKVASYCAQRYVDEANKKTALEETKNYTTQSLASVAYQINTLASNMLQMLDIQAAQLASMDSSINNIAQTVDIHKEKVARREIGLLTTSKVITRSHQIVAPTNPERPVKYVRKPVDYTELDDIGHGVKVNAQQQPGTPRRPSAVAVKSPPSPPAESGLKRDSFHSSSGYGTLRAVRAPTVPQEYHSSTLPSGRRGMEMPPPPIQSGMVPSSMPPPPPMGAEIPPPPLAMSPQVAAPPPPAFPVSSASPDSSGGYSTPNIGYDGRPPVVGGTAETYASTSVMGLPPPPPPTNFPSSQPPFGGTASRNPNLPTTGFAARMAGTDSGTPPPPSLGGNILPPPSMGGDILPPPPPVGSGGDSSMDGFSMEPDWAPKSYLEKMVVIYDYSAENADELNMKEDEVVYVVKKNDDGWYEGVLNGVTGLFPGNYAEPVSA